MNDTQVVTVSNRFPREYYYRYDLFLESLRRFAEAPTVLGMNEQWSGLMTKPNHYRKWLREKKNTRPRILICDAWDIIFASHPHGIGDRCAEWFGDDAIVFNGERACWPRSDLSEHFPNNGSPWRYLNSGFMCGRAEKILELLESMDLESIGVDRTENGKKIEPNDQGEFQKAFVTQPVKMVVDPCRVSQTFSGCNLADDFDFSDGKVFNKVTGTYPGVLHANGQKEIVLPILAKLLNL